jgi:glycosyltransferase involved in cell wall biosynthesis
MSVAETSRENRERDGTRLPFTREGEDPLVSVVIPAYNRAATILACLESVQAQTYPHWEAIVVDDGSLDNTPDLVLQKAATDPRIRLVRQERNSGAQAARNVGIRIARGDWIGFLDSDDQYLPESIERRLRAAERAGVSVVHSECLLREGDQPLVPNQVPPMSGRLYRRLLAEQGPMFQGLLARREELERIGYLDENIVAFQEWDTAIRLARHAKFAFEPEPTFVYDCRTDLTISKDRLRGGRGYEQVMRKHFAAILFLAGPKVMARHYQVASEWYEAGGDLRSAQRCRRNLRLCLAGDPGSVFRKLRRVLGFA